MKPYEFWNSTYREINVYTKVHLAKMMDELKTQINLQEAVTNKLIKADSMSKKPKIELIRSNYKELFEEEEKNMTPEEITRRMRTIIKSEKKNEN